MPETRVLKFVRRQAHAYKKGRSLPIRNIVLHSSDGRKGGDLETLTGDDVSAHWYVTRAGEVYHLVNDEDTAYHAGRVFNPDFFSNSATIGIEQEHFDPDDGKPNEDWPDAQIDRVAQLVAYLMQEHGLHAPDDIKTHAQIAKPEGRKQDPYGYPFEKFFGLVNSYAEFQWKAEEN